MPAQRVIGWRPRSAAATLAVFTLAFGCTSSQLPASPATSVTRSILSAPASEPSADSLHDTAAPTSPRPALVSSGTSTAGPTSAVAAGPGLVTEPSAYGTILGTSSGRTLYALSGEDQTHFLCMGDCVTRWTPVPASSTARSPGPGVRPELVGNARRPDGLVQLTYAGHPLYTFNGDHRAGDITGQAQRYRGSTWLVVDAASGHTVAVAPGTPHPSGGAGA